MFSINIQGKRNVPLVSLVQWRGCFSWILSMSENWAAPKAADTNTRFIISTTSLLYFGVPVSLEPTPTKKRQTVFHCFMGYKRVNAEKICVGCCWRESDGAVFSGSCDKQSWELRHPAHRPSNQCHMICSLTQSAFFTISTEFLSKHFYVEERWVMMFSVSLKPKLSLCLNEPRISVI